METYDFRLLVVLLLLQNLLKEPTLICSVYKYKIPWAAFRGGSVLHKIGVFYFSDRGR